MKTGTRWMMALLMIVGCLGGARGDAAGRRASPTDAVRIVWMRPQRVSAAQRSSLNRLLNLAVCGKPLRGFDVRDSGPSVEAGDLTANRGIGPARGGETSRLQ